jgi:hypothetical protein
MATEEPLPTIRKYRQGDIDVETETLRVLLFDASQAYSIDRQAHEFVGDVIGTAATELSDGTYSRKNVANAQVTVDGTDGEVVFDADDVTWTGLDGGEEIQGWIVYAQRGGDDTTPGDDPILAIEDEVTNSSGNPVTTNGSDVPLEFNSEGIINVS